MKCFLAGIAGALVAIVGVLVFNSQYSDYLARAETYEWLAKAQVTKSLIEKNATKQGSLISAGNSVNNTLRRPSNLDVFEVTDSGIILLRGGREGQFIALIPSVLNGRIVWRCIGGPIRAMPNNCGTENHR